MSKKASAKVRDFPTQVAMARPNIPMPPEMQMILSGLEENLGLARRGVQLAEQRYNAYIVQCAETLKVNHPSYMFNAESRTFTDNPNYQEPKPIGSGTVADVKDESRSGAGAGA